eukprot:CAMPEP_0184870614 /NCGR_PEP_ID=MMETSP0580-20130426/38140_1 /TAXON_ID=1118495 /ORGANISM="Dactyliosolen fragilissimus" /LENGTH=1203 /DNA_ID=CAMNT_0027372785 /DNA_START=128 /DNA_END=3740 /DNA_ORIENTATION=-
MMDSSVPCYNNLSSDDDDVVEVLNDGSVKQEMHEKNMIKGTSSQLAHKYDEKSCHASKPSSRTGDRMNVKTKSSFLQKKSSTSSFSKRKKSALTSKRKSRSSSPKPISSSTNTKQSSHVVEGRKKFRQVKEMRKRRKVEMAKAAQLTQVNDSTESMGDGKIVCAAKEQKAKKVENDVYWEVEKVVGRRKRNGSIEYLIRWKGCPDSQNTWEPSENLCDTAMDEAKIYENEERRKRRIREESEKKLFGNTMPQCSKTDVEGIKTIDKGKKLASQSRKNIAFNDDETQPVDSQIMKSSNNFCDVKGDNVITSTQSDHSLNNELITNKNYIQFRTVMRINVNDPDAKYIIKEARLNGTPVVLVGHKGWANFAKRWLNKVPKSNEVFDLTKDDNEILESNIINDSANAMPKSEPPSKSNGTNCMGNLGANCNHDTEGNIPNMVDSACPDLANKHMFQKDLHSKVKMGLQMDTGNSMCDSSDSHQQLEAAHSFLDANETLTALEFKGTEHKDIIRLTTKILMDDLKTFDEKLHQAANSLILFCYEISERSDTESFEKMLEKKFIDLVGFSRWKLFKDFAVSSTFQQTNKNLESSKNDCSHPCNHQESVSSFGKSSGLKYESNKGRNITSKDSNSSYIDEKLDLGHPSYSWELDVKKMINDIGTEDVPVVRRNYNESNPLHGVISCSKFLKTCWPIRIDKSNDLNRNATNENDTGNFEQNSKKGSASAKINSSTKANLYLHQWQFPLSDTAGRKLCHQNEPLPSDIFGEDLLKYWIDLPQCKSDSPLQYLFMGREDTMSKLHKDNGGLAITIAPIVGEKECILVHRADGSNCLYHLEAKLDDIDLDTYPLISLARIWKTVISPGEILLMPQGTYHQCRNLTPCLSYSRFHLDLVNLLPFIQSKLDGDAPELGHNDVIWNSVTELIKKVDFAVDETQRCLKDNVDLPKLDNQVISAVNTLTTLRHVVRELSRQLGVRRAVKGNSSTNPIIISTATFFGQKEERMPSLKGNSSNGQTSPLHPNIERSHSSEDDDQDWDLLVDDIDLCLHEFQHRHLKKIPTYFKKGTKFLKNLMSPKRKKGSTSIVAYNTDLDNAYLSLPYLSKRSHSFEDKIVWNDLQVGDKIIIRLQEKEAPADVLLIESNLPCAYVSFDDYPSLYDEFLTLDTLRLPNYGEKGSRIPDEQIKPGMVVIVFWDGMGAKEKNIEVLYNLS